MRRKTMIVVVAMIASISAAADPPTPIARTNLQPYATVARVIPHPYETTLDRLDRAVEAAGMVVVARASATIGAAQRGLTIPGNAVVMVFRNDFALRLLAISEAAGIEAPLRFYVTEGGDGVTRLRYRLPSAVFAPYGEPALDALAAELDPIFAQIAASVAAP